MQLWCIPSCSKGEKSANHPQICDTGTQGQDENLKRVGRGKGRQIILSYAWHAAKYTEYTAIKKSCTMLSYSGLARIFLSKWFRGVVGGYGHTVVGMVTVGGVVRHNSACTCALHTLIDSGFLG